MITNEDRMLKPIMQKKKTSTNNISAVLLQFMDDQDSPLYPIL